MKQENMVTEEEQFNPEQYTSISETQDLSEDFQKYRLNTSEILEELNHRLKGELWNKEKEIWEAKGIALVNEIGRKAIMTNLSIIINKNVILSKFDPDTINLFCEETNSLIREQLIKHQYDWGINSLQDLKVLKNNLMIFIESALRRAEKGFESISIGKVMKTHESQIFAPEKKRGLPFLPGRMRER